MVVYMSEVCHYSRSIADRPLEFEAGCLVKRQVAVQINTAQPTLLFEDTAHAHGLRVHGISSDSLLGSWLALVILWVGTIAGQSVKLLRAISLWALHRLRTDDHLHITLWLTSITLHARPMAVNFPHLHHDGVWNQRRRVLRLKVWIGRLRISRHLHWKRVHHLRLGYWRLTLIWDLFIACCIERPTLWERRFEGIQWLVVFRWRDGPVARLIDSNLLGPFVKLVLLLSSCRAWASLISSTHMDSK